MTTPTPEPGAFQVTYTVGDLALRTHTVQADGFEIDANVGFVFFQADEQPAKTAFSIRTDLVVSIERITEKG